MNECPARTVLVCHALLLHVQTLSAVVNVATHMHHDDTGGKTGGVSELHFVCRSGVIEVSGTTD